ncbi:Lipoteichoic acid synthase 2 [Pirellulimonas nuda]|uniref:Lipoteichoic acid synthase 2 n=1 Tax=Pirellulimonas nuda TaxID=2528009 RepID=A0A518D855_9BACT|nr:sulfatase [Pirellulimonas nuda]QDU87643.1 Lipoteichoic acid synthase 2 [Pirellulimonas nuda]
MPLHSRAFAAAVAVLLLLGPAAGRSAAADRPNVLWITSEDNAAYWLGCYAAPEARSEIQTPRLDAFAAEGVQFNHAYSNAPVCAVARCTLLTGVYAVSLGTQHMRSRHAIPASIKPYVSYLREQGYYCTNNSKTDYNFRVPGAKVNDASYWDACSGKAHYKNRPEGSPFFAIFNLTTSHESSLFPDKVRQNRKRGLIPQQPRNDPAKVTVPPHLPDLPEVREDIAIYHDTITALDTQVGELLDELESLGLAEDTIVFYYGDHGGVTPRGKRYLTDTGVRVPMLIHVPEKWRGLSPFSAGEKVDELVAFVDLAPTALSLVGLDKPSQMQGRAFLGEHRVEPPKNDVAFLYGDRFDEIVGMRRGVTNGRWKYIRRFTPYLPAAPYSTYLFGQPAWVAWRDAWKAGTLPERFNQIWETPQPVEMLFDTAADPWEVNNLADDPAHTAVLRRMRSRLSAEMIEAVDTGLVPESMFKSLAGQGTMYDYVRSDRFDVSRTLTLALDATSGDPAKLPAIEAALADPNPVTRYWGAVGCMTLGKAALAAKPALEKLLDDDEATNRVAAARALAALGDAGRGKAALFEQFDRGLNAEETVLLLNAVRDADAMDDAPDAWIDRALSDRSTDEYVRRLFQQMKDQRSASN